MQVLYFSRWSFVAFEKKSFFASDKQLKTPSPILRVLDAKKLVVGTYRSQKHKLQHPYAPNSSIFHEKKAKNGVFWLQTSS